jgi:predicted dehydrogenase
MTDAKLPIAVVGCGAVAAGHYLPSLAASRRLRTTLLVDRDGGRARTLADRWGVPGVSTEIGDVPRHARAAVVALPNALHAPVTLELLRSGVSVLVEKPMAIRAADCDAMAAAARDAGATLAVGLQFRYFDSTRWVRETLQSGLLGPLRRFELRLGVVSRWPFASDYVLRREIAGGGVLTDYGAHVLDLLCHWLGDFAPPGYRDDARGGVESECEIELLSLAGVPGRVEISRTRNLRNTCRFDGEAASLEVGIWDPDPPIWISRPGSPLRVAGRARAATGGGLDFNGAFLRSLDDFAGAIAEGRETAVPAAEGRRAVALIESCYARSRPLVLPWHHPPQLDGGDA